MQDLLFSCDKVTLDIKTYSSQRVPTPSIVFILFPVASFLPTFLANNVTVLHLIFFNLGNDISFQTMGLDLLIRSTLIPEAHCSLVDILKYQVY